MQNHGKSSLWRSISLFLALSMELCTKDVLVQMLPKRKQKLNIDDMFVCME